MERASCLNFTRWSRAMNDTSKIQSHRKDNFWHSINSRGTFSPDQIKQISSLISADKDAQLLCIAKTAGAARELIILNQFSDATKTQNYSDLLAMREASLSLKKSIGALGSGARAALAENFIQAGGELVDYEGEFFLREIVLSCEELLLFSEGAIELAKSGKGAREKVAERKFFLRTRDHYVQATQGKIQGFWQFFRAVTEALDDVLPQHLSRGDYENWQSAWRKKQSGNNSRKTE